MECNKKDRIARVGEVCFWLAMLIELILVIIDKSDFVNPIEGQIFRVTFCLFLVKMITTKYSLKEWCIIGLFGGIAMISYLINTKDEAVRLVVFIASCKGLELRKMLKVSLYVTLVGCLGIIILSISGIFGKVSLTLDYGREVVETRYILGMGHPNALHCMVLMVLSLVIYLYESRMKWYHFILLGLVNVVFIKLDDSNTGGLMVFFMLVGAAVFHYIPVLQDKKWVLWAAILLMTSCLIFSMIGAYYGNSTPWAKKIDDFLNGRYKSALLVDGAKITQWKLFSCPENADSFDAAYIKLFYWYGIIPAICYIVGTYYLLVEAFRKKDSMLIVLLMTYSVYNLMEAHLISLYLLRNYLFLFMGYYWNQRLIEKGETESYCFQFWTLFRSTDLE